MQRRRLALCGIVQGVGFRPLAHRLALQEGLSGVVCNAAEGVVLEVQGKDRRLDRFVERLLAELPVSARVDACSVAPLEPVPSERGFAIVASTNSGPRTVGLAPDSYVCADCLQEMRDPQDRRYRYPLISCTHCGPRYTITADLPYDRPRTTMACFAMCADCEREYRDPSNRRYHAQPIACPACGPRVWLALAGQGLASSAPPQPAGSCRSGPDSDRKQDPAAAVTAACDLLQQGRVVAVKGIGGFLLAVDARNPKAVQRLRKIKRRPRKPMAVMVRDLATADAVGELNEAAKQLLCSPAAPIVLAPQRDGHGLAAGLAPGLQDLGVMLPSSPLHHLLLAGPLDTLVMTSGNPPSEPMVTANRAALQALHADAYLLHDRDIHVAADDSVVRPGGAAPVFLRRARGYVPRALDVSFLPARFVVALGAELKVTVSILSHRRLMVGRHLGDLHNAAAERAFEREVERMLGFSDLQPEIVAVDQHPDLASTLLGEQMTDGGRPGAATDGPRLVRVQHHHAHLCAVLVEHGISPQTTVAGVILDGMGYGPDGTIWGGEILCGGYAGFDRVAHLRPVPQPGGDRAALEPHRMATSLLWDAGLGQQAAGRVYDEQIADICGIRAVSPLTSSAGRLFDGAAAILGLAPEVQNYEGEAAAVLEATANPACKDAYPLPLDGRQRQLDTRALIEALVQDKADVSTRAARFHNALADGFARAAQASGTEIAALGGGCMVNRLLMARLVQQLEQSGMIAKYPLELPPGDGGLSAGQAAVAACSGT